MKNRINEEVGTSISESVKSLIFIDLGSFLSHKGGSLVVMLPDTGAKQILKWMKFVYTNPIYQENKSRLDALAARFSGNGVIMNSYAKINKIKSDTVASAEENAKREQSITRELGRVGKYIQSKLTDVERQLFAKVSADLRAPSLLLVKSLNDKLTSTINAPVPEEPAAPDETPETNVAEPLTEPSPEAKPAETSATEPKVATVKKVAEPSSSPKPTTAEPIDTKTVTNTTSKPAPKAVPAEKPADKPAPKAVPDEKPADKPAPKAEPKPKDEPDGDNDKQEESIRRIKNVIREYILREIRSVVTEAGFDTTTDWKKMSKPFIVGGRDNGFILPNGITMQTTDNWVCVESPDLIRKVNELLTKKVIIPVSYHKTHKKTIFEYKQIDEDSIGLVLFSIK